MDEASFITNERKTLANLEIIVFLLLLALVFLLAGQVGRLAATSTQETIMAENTAVREDMGERSPYCYSECGFMR